MILGSLLGLDRAQSVVSKLLDHEDGKPLALADESLANIEAQTKEALWSNPRIEAELLKNPVIMAELRDVVQRAVPDLTKP